MKKINVLIFYRLQRLFLFMSWRHDLSMFCLVLLWLLQAFYQWIMMNGWGKAGIVKNGRWRDTGVRQKDYAVSWCGDVAGRMKTGGR